MPSKISFFEHGRLSKQEFLKLCFQGTYENNLGLVTSAIQLQIDVLSSLSRKEQNARRSDAS